MNIIPPLGAVRVYRFPVFEKSFCDELLEELEHFEQSPAPKGRPNTMNHYGVTHPLLLEEVLQTELYNHHHHQKRSQNEQ